MLEALLKFKGTDWIGMVFGLIATYALAKEKRAGFLFGVVGGFGWVTFGLLTGSIASIIANLCFISCNLHGYYCWRKKGKGDLCWSPVEKGSCLIRAFRNGFRFQHRRLFRLK